MTLRMILPPESLKFCAHYSRLEIEQLRAPTRAALISIRDPGSSRPAYEIEQWPDLLELEFHDITSEQPRDEGWWELWAKEGYIVPCRDNAISICQFVRQHWERSIIVHCEMGLSRSAAVCEVLVGLGWAYQPTRPDGRSRANRRLVHLLQQEFALLGR